MTSLTPTSSILPDINLWLALNFERHSHSSAAASWYESLDPLPRFVFCRQTQLGLFRMLSNSAVMGGKPLGQSSCWQIYDQWIDSGQAVFLDEPRDLERSLRAEARTQLVATKLWMDSYLAAFAESGGLTLVTFDRALAGRTPNSVLLA
jgi:toxin-antitoxin system PIN domain toxin